MWLVGVCWIIALIDPITNDWDGDLLHEMFMDRDVQLIKQIPVAITFEDQWFWKGDIRGVMESEISSEISKFFMEPESLKHILCDCSYVSPLWSSQVHVPLPSAGMEFAIGAFPAYIFSGSITATARIARNRRMPELPPSMMRNWAASAPQWRAISPPVACQAARSLETIAVGPGMRLWSLRSLINTKMRRHVRAPMAEMLSRYCMLPYHAVPKSKSPSPPEGGGESVESIPGDD
nr:uncharacterized protein LOC109146988 [Ipomoea batatas]